MATLACVAPPVGLSQRAAASPVKTASCLSGHGVSLVALPARGARVVSNVDVPVCATGAVTVTFAGDPAAGCTTNGLCDISGNDVYTPGSRNVGDLFITSIDDHGHRSTTATLSIDASNAQRTSTVQRTMNTPTGAQTTSCSDEAGSGSLALAGGFNLRAPSAQVPVKLSSAMPVLGSRCAGPVEADIATAMPTRMVTARTLEHGDTTIDLSGGGQFVAHGMSGTVASTLVLTLGRPHRIHQTLVPKPPPHMPVSHSVSVAYRVMRLTGRAVATVRASSMLAACGPLDACGLAGTITVRPGASTYGSVSLFATASSTPVRVLRAALRGEGPSSATVSGGGLAKGHGTVRAQLAQDGVTCSDTVALDQFVVGMARSGRWLHISLSPSQSQAADPLRTRCPGPNLGFHHFAVARVPVSVLGKPAFTATLHGTSFNANPYRVSTHATLAVTFRRGATRAGPTGIVTVGNR